MTGYLFFGAYFACERHSTGGGILSNDVFADWMADYFYRTLAERRVRASI